MSCVYTLAVANWSKADQTLVQSLAGLLNRESPVVYLVWDGEAVNAFPDLDVDQQWLAYFETSFGLEYCPLEGRDALIRLALKKKLLVGYVVWDPDVPDTRNLATTLAGLENLAVAAPEHIPILDALGLSCMEDFRGRFYGASRYDIYKWAMEQYWERCDPAMVACLDVEQHQFVDLAPYLTRSPTVRVRIDHLTADGVDTGTELQQVAVLSGGEHVHHIDVDSPSASREAVDPDRGGDSELPDGYEYTFDLSPFGDPILMVVARGIYTISIQNETGDWCEVVRKAEPFFQGGYVHFIDTYIRDFCVAHKLFCFSLGCVEALGEEYHLRCELMDRIGRTGKGTVLGWHVDREHERDHLIVSSRYGNVVHCSGNTCNMSLVQHLKRDSYRISDPPPCPVLEDKVYLSFIVGDGDATWSTYTFNGGFFLHPSRGKYPYGWGLQMQAIDLCPGYYCYYLDHATENDCFVAASSGVGYSYPDVMMPERFSVHLARSRDYLQKTGIRVVQMYPDPRECDGNGLSREQRAMIDAVWGDLVLGVQEGYWAYQPPTEDVVFDKMVYAYTRLPNCEIWGGPQPANFKKALMEMVSAKGDRPMFIMAHPWIEEMPVDAIEKLIDELPDDIVVVRPDHLLELEHQAQKQTKDMSNE